MTEQWCESTKYRAIATAAGRILEANESKKLSDDPKALKLVNWAKQVQRSFADAEDEERMSNLASRNDRLVELHDLANAAAGIAASLKESIDRVESGIRAVMKDDDHMDWRRMLRRVIRLQELMRSMESQSFFRLEMVLVITEAKRRLPW